VWHRQVACPRNPGIASRGQGLCWSSWQDDDAMVMGRLTIRRQQIEMDVDG